MASGSKVAVANCSTYIQGCLSWDANATSSGIVVNARLYMRRTNVYSGDTYSDSVTQYLGITSDTSTTGFNYSQTTALHVYGGQQNTWQGPYFTASRTFDNSRGGETIYVRWRTVDNLNKGFLSGGGNSSSQVAITLPQAYTAPNTPTISASANGVNAVNVTYGTSSFGNPSSGTVYLYGTASGSTSSITSKTSTGNSTYSHTGRTGNTRYYYRSRASNGQLWSSYSSEVSAVTLAPALSAKSASAASTTSITVSATTAADGGVYAKNIQYNIGNGWVTGATVAAGTTAATAKSFTISGLSTGTAYTINLRVNTSAGNTSSGSVSATTYKIPNDPTTSATNASATSNTITYGTTSFNTPSSGTVILYCGVAGGVYEEITRKNTTGNSTYTHSNLTGNTKYWYKSRANNAGGWTAYSSESIVITRPATPTITINSLGHHTVSLSINSPSQGSAATMTAYYKVDGGSTISAGTISSGGSATVQLSFDSQTPHTVTAYLSNSSGDSGEATSTFTTKIPFYAPVSGQSKMAKKLYCSVNGQAKLVQHLYGSVNGQAKKIF